MAKKTRRAAPCEIEVEPTRCPRCGSTERERYSRTIATPHAGTDAAGRPFTHVVRRWTRCQQCGQARVERTLEHRPSARSDG